MDYAAAMPGANWPGYPDPPVPSNTDLYNGPGDWGENKYDHHGIVSRCCTWSDPSGNPAGVNGDLKITFASITDGSSNTIMVSEKWCPPRLYINGSAQDDEGWCSGWDEDIMHITAGPPRRDFDFSIGDEWGNPGNDVRCWGNSNWNQTAMCFGSAHPGGINALFGDGSVRNVAYDIDQRVFWRLGGRDDGVSVSFD